MHISTALKLADAADTLDRMAVLLNAGDTYAARSLVGPLRYDLNILTNHGATLRAILTDFKKALESGVQECNSHNPSGLKIALIVKRYRPAINIYLGK